jgi:tRNA (cmo5U34)-methyltransferase
MSEFEKSRWYDSQFTQDYRDDANIYLPFRSKFIEVIKSFFKFFISPKQEIMVLDLGCGDGLFIQELLRSFKVKEVVMIDGSREMLAAAKERLDDHAGLNFIRANFQELQANDPLDQKFDFIFSSLAIHHLTLDEKTGIYGYIYNHLTPSGHFLNYDIVLSPGAGLEDWCMSLWRQWIVEHPDKNGAEKLIHIPDQYKANSDNIPDRLGTQLNVLKKIGFQNVDCFLKYGAFSLFGGSR